MRNLQRMLLIFVIILLVVYIFQITSQKNTPINISNTTYYTVVSEVEPINESNKDNYNWELLSSLDNSTLNPDAYLWLQIKLPLLKKDISGIYIPNIVTKGYRLYSENGQLISTSNYMNAGYQNVFLLESLPHSASTKHLYMSIELNDFYNELELPIYIGNYSQLTGFNQNEASIMIYMGFALMIIAVMVLPLSFGMNTPLKLSAYMTGIVVLSYGYIIAFWDTRMIHTFSNNQNALYFLFHLFVLLLLFNLFTYYKLNIIPNKKSIYYNVLWLLVSIFTLLGVVILVKDIMITKKMTSLGYFYTNQVFVLHGLGILFLLAHSFYSLKKEIENSGLIFYALAIFLITMVTDIALSLIQPANFQSMNLWKWGLIASTITHFYLLLRKYKQANTRYSTLPKELISINEYSKSDYITSLPNKLTTMEHIGKAMEKSSFGNKPFSIALCDIDHLSSISDTYGSYFKNQILVQIASVLHNYINNEHFIGRWDQDSFMLIFYNLTNEEAMELANKVRTKVKFTPFKTDNEIIHVSVTVGVAHYNKNITFNQFVDQGKQALYFGQHHGYDTAISYSDINQSDTDSIFYK